MGYIKFILFYLFIERKSKVQRYKRWFINRKPENERHYILLCYSVLQKKPENFPRDDDRCNSVNLDRIFDLSSTI